MGTLKIMAVGLALCQAAPAGAGEIKRWRPYVAEASARFGIPVSWIERVIDAESRGETLANGQPIVSPAGAMGLMQLMPGTWSDMRARLGLGADPHEPRDNILAGTCYLRLMYDRFGYPGLFGAYNAGPARYAAFAERGRTLPAETRSYMAIVTAGRGGRVEAPVSAPSDIFFPLSGMAGLRTRGIGPGIAVGADGGGGIDRVSGQARPPEIDP